MKGYTTTSFIDDVVAGRASEADVDDYIDYWHTHQTGNELREYIGLSDEEYGMWLRNDSLLAAFIDQRRTVESRLKITVPYVSVWDGGTEVETSATVNIKTGEVTDIEVAKISGLEICEREYIMMNGEQVDVYHDEHGYEHWADI